MTDISARRRSILFFAVSFLQALDNQIVPVLLPVIRDEMGGAPAGQLLTAYALACGIVPFLATARGRSDRLTILCVGALIALGGAAFAFAATTSLWARLALRAVAGASSGILSMTLLLAAARTADDEGRTRQFTVINAGYLSALVLGVPIGAWVVKHVDLRTVYASIGVLALVLTVPLAIAFRGAAPGEAARPGGLIKLFSRREAALILAATGLVGAAMAGPVGFLGSFLSSFSNFEIDQIGAVYMCGGLGPILAMPMSGRLITRFLPHRVAIAGSLVIAAPILLFPTLGTSLPSAAILMLVCVAIETVRRAALQGSLADAVPAADLPRFLALRGVIVQMGLAAGSALAEVLFSRGGFDVVCGTAAGLSLSAAAVLFLATRQTTPRA